MSGLVGWSGLAGRDIASAVAAEAAGQGLGRAWYPAVGALHDPDDVLGSQGGLRTGAGGIFVMSRLRASAAGEWMTSGSPAVSWCRNWASVIPQASHSAARPSNSPQSCAESDIR